MGEIEKVIKGLECCRDGFCNLCPYDNITDESCRQSLEDDALTLLKAQRPRVLTVDEVRNSYDSPIWFESHGTFYGKKGFWCLNLGVSPSFHIRLIPAIGEQSTSTTLSLTVYGSVWRCWTSRPTDEQRKAVKWNE